jgi:hypothetical protein
MVRSKWLTGSSGVSAADSVMASGIRPRLSCLARACPVGRSGRRQGTHGYLQSWLARPMLRPMSGTDPQHLVEAPVRRALLRLIVRGVGLVAVVLALVLAPSVPSLTWTRDLATVLIPVVLFGVAGLIRLERQVRGRPSDAARADAWARARAMDEADAMLALVVAGWVPVALAAGLVILAGPHFAEPDLEVRGVWWAFGIPVLLTGWIVATNGFLEAARDELAFALGESDRRFRAYWADPGR